MSYYTILSVSIMYFCLMKFDIIDSILFCSVRFDAIRLGFVCLHLIC